jgi:hypothetical protein
MVTKETSVKLADRIWIAVALLHREMSEREDFTRSEIRSKLRMTGLMEQPVALKPKSVSAHLKEHLVANLPPSSSKYRMLYETQPGALRLFRMGDFIDPGRQPRRPSSHIPKHIPVRDEIPAEYRPLLDWYESWSKETHATPAPINWEDDPLIRLIGSGKHIWADEHADEYVENLRREEPA